MTTGPYNVEYNFRVCDSGSYRIEQGWKHITFPHNYVVKLIQKKNIKTQNLSFPHNILKTRLIKGFYPISPFKGEYNEVK